ncbi:ParA family protein [Burkholderia thailandensis]|uniref:ParA family protein n=1 Tax=Burkholderia thailandensis TaxID=57975 RepID=UPI0003ECB1C6|nr:ParA family protein [Burkholderia thailandensis]AHI65061.1 cobQ/CobB/MinD/ParA nucleotide binding domain protein [Burkholderia thailandensis H0587]AOJ52161.1 ATPase [Burkholderia thailandensis]AVR24517.1 ParA family protein [Burkholderia thailandensis]
MPRYALWNNKGGVGKSFLTFALACEYAFTHPDETVLVMDLCPQANLTEMMYGAADNAPDFIDSFYSSKPRRSIGGYFEARLTSPFLPLPSIVEFVTQPGVFNHRLPKNLYLLPGDNLLELLAEAIRQASQMPLPSDAWPKVMRWLLDFVKAFEEIAPGSDVTTFVDCNPSFSVYTQIALCSAESLIVPFTADDSSRRGIENVFALLYGVADNELRGYARLSFSTRAMEEHLELPRIHTFVNNRVTEYRSKPSSAFEAKSKPIRDVVTSALTNSKRIFVSHKDLEQLFAQMPDYHSVAVVASTEGCPLSMMQSGHHTIDGKTVQVNQTSINRYTKAVSALVKRL